MASISMPVYERGTGNLVTMSKGGKPAASAQRRRMRAQANRMAVHRASNRQTSR
jgi:hypothetical protein